MFIYNKYQNSIDYCWYDSSNIFYSEYLNDGETNTMLIVFKNGKGYIYENVSPEDYMSFKLADSTGSVFNKSIIKKYVGVFSKTFDIQELSEKMNNLKLLEESNSKEYHVKFDKQGNEFALFNNEVLIHKGPVNSVSFINLMREMGILYTSELVDDLSMFNPKLSV